LDPNTLEKYFVSCIDIAGVNVGSGCYPHPYLWEKLPLGRPEGEFHHLKVNITFTNNKDSPVVVITK
jgi:hypothetical protein